MKSDLRTVGDLMVGGRAPRTIGSWVSIARNIQVFFAQRKIATVTKGLEQADFGTYGDNEHPVARLIAFRNDFAHGFFRL